MTDIEKRRNQLLKETRNNHSDKYAPPAIHPRYHATYQSVYGQEEGRKKVTRSFFIRVAIAGLVFLFVCIMKDSSQKQKIQNVIQMDLLSQYFPFFIKDF